MKAKLDPPGIAEANDQVSKIVDHVAKLEAQAEAGLLFPWQQGEIDVIKEELALASELLRDIRQAWRGRLH